MNNYILEFDKFVRSVSIAKKDIFTTFLGAGASINSGIPSAADCIWDWKYHIYSSNTSNSIRLQDLKSEPVRAFLQRWLDQQGKYPPLNDPAEYSFYVTECYPIPADRSSYFHSTCMGKEPSIGYKLIAFLNKMGVIQSVWTTNFDDLTISAGYKLNVTVADITLDSVGRIVKPLTTRELMLVKLHGDYKFGPLKNSEPELQSQDALFRQKMIDYLTDKHLIVSGYSGRDTSVMDALKESYSKPNCAGRLYWCGYGPDIPATVQDLLKIATANGRTAFYVPTEGFDKTFISLAKACSQENHAYQLQLAEILKTEPANDSLTPFTISATHLNTILKSNLFLISFPKEVFQFKVKYSTEETPWKTIRAITKGSQVVAVPHHKDVWALGTLSDINNLFADRLEGDITRVRITHVKVDKDGSLHHLLLAGITRLLAARHNLTTNNKDTLWHSTAISSRMINNVLYFSHKAIRLSLNSDGQHYFLSMIPDFRVSMDNPDAKVSKEIKQQIGLTYFHKIRNKEFNTYVNEWRSLLFGNSGEKTISLEFPLDSASGLNYIIRRTQAFASIMDHNSQSGHQLADSFPKALLYFKGIQYPEPPLVFSKKHAGMGQVPRDFHPMRGLTMNRPYDSQSFGGMFDSNIKIGVVCPAKESGKFAQFLQQVQTRIAKERDSDYLIDYPGFYEAYGVSLDIPTVGMENWNVCPEPTLNDSLKAISFFIRDQIIRSIDLLSSDGIKKVIVICIPDRWLDFCTFDLENESFDLHDYVKAYCASKSIATQFIKEDTLGDVSHCQINWWLSLSYYVKSLRSPWVLDNMDVNTAFAGIGYSVTKRTNSSDIVLGCSHIYNSQGQGLKYRLSKVEDQLLWDRLDRPHLTYNDAYNFGLSILELFYSTLDTLPRRVVIHKRNFYMLDEINGLRDSILQSGVRDLDLIEINFEDDIRFVAAKIKDGVPDIIGFPVRRGTCIPMGDCQALLWTHGAVPSVKSQYSSFYLGGRYIPGPLRITKHLGKTNIDTVANEIMGLTKVNWNSFDLYSQLPATISSSHEIARIGKLMPKKEGANYDYRFFI